MQIKHKLKIEHNYLEWLVSGHKKSEIRYNDRDYQSGDVLEFWRSSEPLGHFVRFKIVHIHSGLGMQDGFVCLSLERIGDEE